MQKLLQWVVNLKARTLFTLVFVSGIVLVMAVMVLLHTSLAIVTEKTNDIDTHRAQETAQAALTTQTASLTETLLDNAVWNGGQEQIYGRGLETQWLRSTWAARPAIATVMTASISLMNNTASCGGHRAARPICAAGWSVSARTSKRR
ncbi:hypothetical protein MMA231_03348 [Asticcacaulis sp. MM231]|uniref:hypothetical protein n=1 Tax=Asticcacaulis sp. MM231 TaxID=3157666 RepID=UPI0032D5A9B7